MPQENSNFIILDLVLEPAFNPFRQKKGSKGDGRKSTDHGISSFTPVATKAELAYN